MSVTDVCDYIVLFSVYEMQKAVCATVISESLNYTWKFHFLSYSINVS